MLLVLSIFGCQVQFERSPNRFFSLLFGAVSSSSQSPQTPTATIGGTITGLTSNGLILRLNNQTLQTIASGASNYKFTEVPVGTFTLDFQSTPPGLFCLFVEQTNSFSISGNTTDSNVSSLNINCSPTQVASVYPTNGANWNQYIQYPIFPTLINGVETPYATADTACTPTNTYRSCIHGAVLKQIPLPGLKSCTGITAYDYDSSSNLVNGLQWSCMVDATGNYWIRSSGLREEKGLRDFIDFSSSTWKQMKVRVFYNDSQVFETSPIVWWSNTIVNQNTTCLIAIPTGNQIYIIGNALSCNTTSLSNNRIAVVSSPGTQVQFVNASSSFLQGNFNWIEINYISNGTPTSAINLSNTRFWHIRNSNFVNLGSNVAITSSTGANNNRIHGSFITGNIGFTNAVSFSSLTDISNVFSNNRIINSNTATSIGFAMSSNPRYNIYIGNTIGGIAGGAGMNQLCNSFAANTFVFNMSGAAAPAIDTAGQGNTTYINTNVINVAGSSIGFRFSFGVSANQVDNIASNMVTTSISVNGTSVLNYFSGRMVVPTNSCNVGVGASYITSGTTCAPSAPSNQVVVNTAGPFSTEFVGLVSGDSVNGTAGATTNTIVAGNSVSDWTNFENRMRAWVNQSSPFPSSGSNTCSGVTNCRIADLSLRSSASIFRNVNSCPNGSVTGTIQYYEGGLGGSNTNCVTNMMRGAISVDANSCSITYLKNAVELLDDGIGNDNGYCESNEACLYTPNIHSYQGHSTKSFGELVPASTTTPTTNNCADITTGGTIQNVKLFKYDTNGR